MDLTSYEIKGTQEDGFRLEHKTCKEGWVREWDVADIDDNPTISSILQAATQHDVGCRAKVRLPDPGRKVTRAG